MNKYETVAEIIADRERMCGLVQRASAILHGIANDERSSHVALKHMAAQGLIDLQLPGAGSEHHKLDNDRQVFFYEQDFYVLSSFAAFSLQWKGIRFDTSEAAYHWEKFPDEPAIRSTIIHAPSAHAAFQFAQHMKHARRRDWDEVKVGIMHEILRAKVAQHAYVRSKLLATGDRELIEDSWRDDFWGWGPNRDGQNMLGKLWMEVRSEIRAAAGPATPVAMEG